MQRAVEISDPRMLLDAFSGAMLLLLDTLMSVACTCSSASFYSAVHVTHLRQVHKQVSLQAASSNL
jgi:hypothetical protein